LPHPTHPYSSSGRHKSRSLHTQIYCIKPERHTEKDEKERDRCERESSILVKEKETGRSPTVIIEIANKIR
jgi:hypothetical protein